MTPGVRKFALTAHIVLSVGWLGAIVAYLALAIAGLTGDSPPMVRAAYLAMEFIGWYVIVPFSLATVLAGLVEALGTPWGLFRHWWVLLKFLLTTAATIVLLRHMPTVTDMAGMAAQAMFSAFGLAVAVQLLLLPAIFGAGIAHPAELPMKPVAAIFGGVLFGVSMRWAGGCAAGVWYKLGAGEIGSLLAILGMALGATAADSGPLAGVRVALQEVMPSLFSWNPSPLISVAAGLLLLAALAGLPSARAGAWTWRRTGLWIGVTAAIAWPLSAAAGRDFGLAVVPGTTGLLSGLAGHSFAAWDALLVLGILGGGWLAARRSGPVALNAPQPAVLLKRLAGGIGLGIGASIATGCTVGQGLTGLALLAPSSFLVMGAIFGGSTLATVAARRIAAVARPMIPSSRGF